MERWESREVDGRLQDVTSMGEAAWGRHWKLPQQRVGWEADGSWDSLLGGVLPACPSPSAPPHLSYLAWEVWAPLSLWGPWFFWLPTSFVSHLRNSGGVCLQVPGLPRSCCPPGRLPSIQRMITCPDMKLCKHMEGHKRLIFRDGWLLPPIWWEAKLLPPNPNVRIAEKLLSEAGGTDLPPLQSTSLPAAVFAFSLVSH